MKIAIIEVTSVNDLLFADDPAFNHQHHRRCLNVGVRPEGQSRVALKVQRCPLEDALLKVVAFVFLGLHVHTEIISGALGKPPQVVHAVFVPIQDGRALAQQVVR